MDLAGTSGEEPQSYTLLRHPSGSLVSVLVSGDRPACTPRQQRSNPLAAAAQPPSRCRLHRRTSPVSKVRFASQSNDLPLGGRSTSWALRTCPAR